jgi:hypothetical protein
MPLRVYLAALFVAGSCFAWAALPLGSYVASLPAAIFAMLPAVVMAARIPKPVRGDVRNYAWPTATFFLIVVLLALGMMALGQMGARLR